MAKKRGKFDYDVAVSFAGENRAAVDRFVSLLQSAGLSVFYDTDEQGELWGKDLYEHLDEVYKHQARFCVMFISEHYARKRWTNHERKSAQERAFKENREYILPVRIDDTALPGIRDTVGYLDLRQKSIEEVAALTVEKVRSAKGANVPLKAEAGRGGKQGIPKRVSATVVDSSGDWIMLNDEFYQARSVERPDDKTFVVTVVSQDAATDARLESARNHRNSGTRNLSFAFANDAFLVQCESAASVYEGGVHRWRIKLTKDDNQSGGVWGEMSYSDGRHHYSAEDIVRLRAERILLGKGMAQKPEPGPRGNLLGGMIESFVQGSNNSIKVTSSPIVELAKKMSRTDGRLFLTHARLITLFYLKVGGVVEQVERLTLGPLESQSVHVVFRGVRRKKYFNVDPEVIQIEGDCALP